MLRAMRALRILCGPRLWRRSSSTAIDDSSAGATGPTRATRAARATRGNRQRWLGGVPRRALDAVIEELSGYKDQMCGCPNTDCLEKINDDMNAWGKAQVKGLKDAPMTDAQTARLKTTMEEMQKCVKRISNMGG